MHEFSSKVYLSKYIDDDIIFLTQNAIGNDPVVQVRSGFLVISRVILTLLTGTNWDSIALKWKGPFEEVSVKKSFEVKGITKLDNWTLLSGLFWLLPTNKENLR